MMTIGMKKDTADEAIATFELPCILTVMLLLDSLAQFQKKRRVKTNAQALKSDSNSSFCNGHIARAVRTSSINIRLFTRAYMGVFINYRFAEWYKQHN